MRVNNINGTSEKSCFCGNWLNHWKKFSGQATSEYCAAHGCLEEATVGAHVQRDSSSDRGWYIIPFCDKHNRETGQTIEIGDTVALASANVSTTCGKKAVSRSFYGEY